MFLLALFMLYGIWFTANMSSKELKERLETCKDKLESLKKHLNLDQKRANADKLKQLSQADDFWQDQMKAQATLK